MVWAKLPTAVTASLCATCIAAAVAVPAVVTAVDPYAETMNRGVQLSAIENLDLINAVPLYLALLGGDLGALDDLDLINGIPGLLAILEGDTSGYALVDGINAYLALLEADTPAEVDTALEGIDLISGIPALTNFPVIGLEAFRPDDEDGSGGYAALSALPEYEDLLIGNDTERLAALNRLESVNAIDNYANFFATGNIGETGLGGIDAFSALPLYSTILDEDASPGERADAIRGLDAFSAIPEYLGLPTAEDEEADALTLSRVAKTPEPVIESSDEDSVEFQAEDLTPKAPKTGPVENVVNNVVSNLPAPQAAVTAPVTPPAPAAEPDPKTTKKAATNGSYSGNFSPDTKTAPPWLTGGGGSGEEGMRGYGNFLKKIGLNGGETSGEGGAEGAGAGE